MPSYETRINVLEDKLAFCMQLQKVTLQVGSPLDATPRLVQCTLAELYKQVKAVGGTITPVDGPAPLEGEVIPEAS